MIKRLAIAIAALMTPALAAERPAYAEGQVWEYRTRPKDEGSLVRIQKIEVPAGRAVAGPIYHVSVVGVRFEGSPAAAAVLGHLPVARETLDSSLTRLAPEQSAGAFPSADEGIAQWRSANGGVFTIPLAEIVEVAEQAMSEARRAAEQ